MVYRNNDKISDVDREKKEMIFLKNKNVTVFCPNCIII